jgi:hypothetical protein
MQSHFLEPLQSSQKWNIGICMVSNVNELIEKFGGVKPFAEAIGLQSIPPVYRAKDNNHIPYKWRMRVLQEAKRRRIKVSPDLLGLETA